MNSSFWILTATDHMNDLHIISITYFGFSVSVLFDEFAIYFNDHHFKGEILQFQNFRNGQFILIKFLRTVIEGYIHFKIFSVVFQALR